MIKLIASDMDGTLLNRDSQVSEENIKAIKEATSKGIRFVIATGRDYFSVNNIMKPFGIDCEYVLMNGAEYRDNNGKIIESINLNKKKTKNIIDIINKQNMSVEIYTSEGIFSADTEEKSLKELTFKIQTIRNIEKYEEAEVIAKNIINSFGIKYIDNVDKFINSEIDIRKIIAFYNDVEVIKETKGMLDKIDGLAVSSSFRQNIEVTDQNAQKGLILEKVISKYGIKKDETMVLGDSFNDKSLFTRFPISFAMGNALPEIKELGKYVTATNNEAGVAKAIYKMIR